MGEMGTAWSDQRRLDYLERVSVTAWDDDDKRFVFAQLKDARDLSVTLKQGLTAIGEQVALIKDIAIDMEKHRAELVG